MNEALKLEPQVPKLKSHNTEYDDEVIPGGVNKRIIAYFLDGLVLAPLNIGANILTAKLEIPFLIVPLSLLIVVGYWIIPTFVSGKTLGKKIMGLKVVNFSGEERSLFKVIIRETIAKYISIIPLGLGLLWFRFRKDRRAWHDLMCSTIVIEDK